MRKVARYSFVRHLYTVHRTHSHSPKTQPQGGRKTFITFFSSSSSSSFFLILIHSFHLLFVRENGAWKVDRTTDKWRQLDAFNVFYTLYLKNYVPLSTVNLPTSRISHKIQKTTGNGEETENFIENTTKQGQSRS